MEGSIEVIKSRNTEKSLSLWYNKIDSFKDPLVLSALTNNELSMYVLSLIHLGCKSCSYVVVYIDFFKYYFVSTPLTNNDYHVNKSLFLLM